MKKKIYIKIETTHIQILKTKIFFLERFFKIFNINFKKFIKKLTKKKIDLLKSPHIHKNTWRKYRFITYTIHYSFNETNVKNIIRLNTLLKILSINSRIAIKYV